MEGECDIYNRCEIEGCKLCGLQANGVEYCYRCEDDFVRFADNSCVDESDLEDRFDKC